MNWDWEQPNSKRRSPLGFGRSCQPARMHFLYPIYIYTYIYIYIDPLGLYDKLCVSKASIKPAPIPFFLHLPSGRRRRKAASAENGNQKRKKRVKEVAVKAMPTKLPSMMVKLVKDLGNPWEA